MQTNAPFRSDQPALLYLGPAENMPSLRSTWASAKGPLYRTRSSAEGPARESLVTPISISKLVGRLSHSSRRQVP